jgi:chitodextrinase
VNPSLSSPSHTPDNWSNDSTVELTWSNASDLRSGVHGYSYGWSQDAATAPDTTNDAEETATATTSPTLADGDWWFHLRTRDNAGNWSGPVHLGPFRIDTTVPANPTLSSPSHTVGIWSNRDTLVIEWGSRPEAKGYSYEWSQTAVTTLDTVEDVAGTVTSVASPRPDGSWWFHFRMVDDSGAWSHTSHMGPFRIDTAAPSSPTASSWSHTPGIPSADRTIDIAWQAVDSTSGLAGYSLAWSTEPSAVPDTLADTTETSATGPQLADGDWWFHVRARDGAGNWGDAAHLGPFRIATPLPPPLPQPQPPLPQPQPPPLQPPPPPPEPSPPQPLPLPPTPPPLQPPPATRQVSSCVVPRLVGRTLKRSRTLLARGGCRLGRVGRVFSSRVPKGRVVVQQRRARIRLARGARVSLALSRGRPPRSP